MNKNISEYVSRNEHIYAVNDIFFLLCRHIILKIYICEYMNSKNNFRSAHSLCENFTIKGRELAEIKTRQWQRS